MYTGRKVFVVEALSRASAILRFRRQCRDAYSYPHVVALSTRS